MNTNFNQIVAGLSSTLRTFKARYWPYIGTTTACGINKVVVVDTGNCGAYNPSGTARSSVAGTPNYVADGSWTDPCANVCLPNNGSTAIFKKGVAAVLVACDQSAVSSTQLAAGEYGTFQTEGRCLAYVCGMDDDAATGANIIAGDLLTISCNATSLGTFRKAKATDTVRARAIATSAGAVTGNLVASGNTGTLILVELCGNEQGAMQA